MCGARDMWFAGSIGGMPASIECPGCGRTVYVVKGRVASHVGWDARRCTVAEVDNGRRSQRQPDDGQQPQQVSAKSKPAVKKQVKGKEPKRPRVPCPRCGKKLARGDDDLLPAHQWPNGQWCVGGVKPSAKRLEKARRDRALRARVVGGGLPGSSRRH